MNRKKLALSPYYEILYITCIASGLLLTADALGGFSYNAPFLPAGVLIFLLFFHYPKDRGLRPALILGFLLLHGLVFLYLLYKQADRNPFYFFLEQEAACLLAAAVCRIVSKRLWMKGGLLLLETGLLAAMSLMHISLPRWGICLILLAGFLFLAELNSSSAYSLLPVLAGVMLLFSFLPVKETPIRWETFQKAADLITEKAHSLIVSLKYTFSDSSLYSVSFTGYGGDGGLGGNLLSSDDVQLSIKGSKTNNPLYLAGTVYDTYTGDGWDVQEKNLPFKTDIYSLQYRKLNALFQDASLTPYKQDFTQSCSFTIEYDGLKTKSLFYAPNTWNFQFSVNTPRNLSGENLLLKKARGVGFTYDMRYMEINYDSDIMQNLLSPGYSPAISYDTPKEAREQEEYSRYCRENFSSLPDSLPHRIRQLAEEVTGNAESDYDKMKALEAYLSQYSYTTSPGIPPKGQDFADAFLFDSRKGYCTYFATAMAVLGRCVQIPTRYVEGFVTKETCSGRNKNIVITGKNAHAWVEAYLEPVGWVVFDATPGYDSSPWVPAETKAGTATGPSAPGEAGQMAEILPEDTSDEDASSSSDTYEKLSVLLPHAVRFLAAFLILCCTLLVFLFLRSCIRRHMYGKLNDYDKVIRLMERILFIGKWSGFPIEESETLEDYEIRISGALNTEDCSFSDICGVYQGIRFGNGDVSLQGKEIMENYVKMLQRQVWDKCGHLKKLSFLFRL